MPDINSYMTHKLQKLDYSKLTMQSPMLTKTYHGVTIYGTAATGLTTNIPIGRITSWNVAARSRTITQLKELGTDSFGRVVENVPGVADNYTVDVSRYEMWEKEMEKVFGFPNIYTDLTDQDHPFQVVESLFKGKKKYSTWTYQGCWFSSIGEDAYDSSGDALVKVNATITYTYRTYMQF